MSMATAETLRVGEGTSTHTEEKNRRRKELMRMRKDDDLSKRRERRDAKVEKLMLLERLRMQEEGARKRRDAWELISTKAVQLERKFQTSVKERASIEGHSCQSCVVCFETVGRLFVLRCGHAVTCAECLQWLDAENCQRSCRFKCSASPRSEKPRIKVLFHSMYVQ